MCVIKICKKISTVRSVPLQYILPQVGEHLVPNHTKRTESDQTASTCQLRTGLVNWDPHVTSITACQLI